jgi:DNA invertase Pin-like site-specific DNA recombinase
LFTVTWIDRLARSIGDLQGIVRTVRARGASLKATELRSTPARPRKSFLDMLGVFAEFETNSAADQTKGPGSL